MKIVIQRVSRASVSIAGQEHSSIGAGVLVLVGVETGDCEADADFLAQKTASMRIFPDADGVMNLSLLDTGGRALAVSQFTLLADARKGNRPSYIRAARPEEAVPLYERYVARLGELLGTPVPTGVFGADMQVELVNDGPVTIILESRRNAPSTTSGQ